MEEPQPKGLPLNSVYKFLSETGNITDAQVLRSANFGGGMVGRRIRKGMAVQLLRDKHLLQEFLAKSWPLGLAEFGQEKISLYDRAYHEFVDKNGPLEPDEDEAGRLCPDADKFAYETDLRDYLARNLSSIEPGMVLWDAANPVEFRLEDNRRIDILAKDRSGTPVIIELKFGQGHEKVIGQALHYRESIKEKFAIDRARIVIVAKGISRELQVACRAVPDSELFEYSIAITLKRFNAAGKLQ